MSSATSRLDAFTDAAFAFAVTLMVVGADGASTNYASLLLIMKTVPSFAIGFAIIAMFWFAHVRWRAVRGDGDWRSVLLTILLVFSVLVYVHPLRAMSSSFAAFLGGRSDGFGGHLAEMFTIYGIGFTVMSAIICALFNDVLRNQRLNRADRHWVLGDRVVWGILAITGALSTIISLIPAIAVGAPFLYATLPVTNIAFAYYWDRLSPADD